MFKKIFLSSFTVLSASINFKTNCLQKAEQELEAAEYSCNVKAYATALQNYSYNSVGVFGLHKIMEHCYKSGRLNELVQINITAGGNPTKLCPREEIALLDYYIGLDISSRIDWQKYDGAALNILCAKNMQNLSQEQEADIKKTVDTLTRSGCTIEKGLLYAAQEGNMTMSQLLMNKGANLYQQVKVDSQGNTVSAIGQAQGLINKIKLIVLQAHVSFRKRHFDYKS